MTLRPTVAMNWMAVADVVAQRSACSRRQAGAVIIGAHGRVLATGYNGPPAGLDPQPGQRVDCSGFCARGKEWTETGTVTNPLSYTDCPAIHAEINALLHSDASLRAGGSIYVTSCPCWSCALAVANSGLSAVFCRVTEHDRDRNPQASLDVMRRSGLYVALYDGADFRDHRYRIDIPLDFKRETRP